MEYITLTKGFVAIVDDEDYDKVIKYNWYAQTTINRPTYAVHDTCTAGNRLLFLHNLVNPPPKGFTNDHIDRDGLNCQKLNLRFATYSQQNANRMFQKKPSSGYRGVYKIKRLWVVYVKLDNRNIYGGGYEDVIDAAKAYDDLATKLRGDFAVLNFPRG